MLAPSRRALNEIDIGRLPCRCVRCCAKRIGWQSGVLPMGLADRPGELLRNIDRIAKESAHHRPVPSGTFYGAGHIGSLSDPI
jgi:hypothetical protein